MHNSQLIKRQSVRELGSLN